jgi:hypothetical protein
MRKTVPLFLVLLMVLGCTGTPTENWTPEKREEAARSAGIAAASGWLLIAKPDTEITEAVRVVTDKIKENLTAYQETGFKGALPGIEEAIGKVLPGEGNEAKRKAAINLAVLLLSELDKLFDDHPAWKSLGGEVSGLIAAFCGGASEALTGLRSIPA